MGFGYSAYHNIPGKYPDDVELPSKEKSLFMGNDFKTAVTACIDLVGLAIYPVKF